MDLLEQCINWNNEGEYEKVVDALEILPDNARTPEQDSELARAYNNLGEPGEYKLFAQALELLEPHEEYFKGDHKFYFRMAYSYFYLDEDGLALHYFRKALDARPGDHDTYEMINACIDYLTNPRFTKDFSERVMEMWEEVVSKADSTVSDNEADYFTDVTRAVAEGILDVFPETNVKVIDENDGYRLELQAGDNKSAVFMLEYIKDTAPEEIRRLFDIKVGISEKDILEDIIEFDEKGYDISNLRFYVTDDRQIIIYAEDADVNVPVEVVQELFVNIFGEISIMANDFRIDMVTEQDFESPSDYMTDIVSKFADRSDFLLECVDYKCLRDRCVSKGFRLGISAEEYLKMYSGYQLQPMENRSDLREDIFTGTTCFPELISEYISVGFFDKTPVMDELHRNGITAGFFCFSVDISSDDTMEYEFEIVKIRDKLIEHIMAELYKMGREKDIRFIEGATGLEYGYLDFILFGSMKDIMNSAYDFFKSKKLSFAAFKTFRKMARVIGLVDEEKE